MISSRLQRFVFMVIQFWSKGVNLSGRGCGRIGPMTTELCLHGRKTKSVLGGQGLKAEASSPLLPPPWAPKPLCAAYWKTLIFQPHGPERQLPAAPTSAEMACGYGTLIATSGHIFQLGLCHPEEEPRRQHLPLKRSWVTLSSSAPKSFVICAPRISQL
jgi:hypothetical protein